MADWSPVLAAVVLFLLLPDPGLPFQLPSRSRFVDFGNSENNGASSIVCYCPTSLHLGVFLKQGGGDWVCSRPRRWNITEIPMDPDYVAKTFVEHYYSTFDANRAGLVSLYQDGSMLTFEGQKIQGAQNIVAKLTGLPFQQCQHSVSTIDCQPSGPTGGMLVFVTGTLQLAGEQDALKFSQMFQLMPTPEGSFYVLNEVFRFNYG